MNRRGLPPAFVIVVTCLALGVQPVWSGPGNRLCGQCKIVMMDLTGGVFYCPGCQNVEQDFDAVDAFMQVGVADVKPAGNNYMLLPTAGENTASGIKGDSVNELSRTMECIEISSPHIQDISCQKQEIPQHLFASLHMKSYGLGMHLTTISCPVYPLNASAEIRWFETLEAFFFEIATQENTLVNLMSMNLYIEQPAKVNSIQTSSINEYFIIAVMHSEGTSLFGLMSLASGRMVILIPGEGAFSIRPDYLGGIQEKIASDPGTRVKVYKSMQHRRGAARGKTRSNEDDLNPG